MAEFDVVHLDDIQFFNLIPSRFPPIPVFERISLSRQDEVAELESLTNPRLKEKQALLGGVAAVDTDIPAVQNWNHAPFAYRNPEGSRFFGPDDPALELAEDTQTALLMAITGRERFLSRTCELPISLEMRELCRTVKGKFADLRGLSGQLHEDDRLKIGIEVKAARLDGLLFNPVERPSATCVSVLTNQAFGRANQGTHFKFMWDGNRIDRLYDFNGGRVFLPLELKAEENILAA